MEVFINKKSMITLGVEVIYLQELMDIEFPIEKNNCIISINESFISKNKWNRWKLRDQDRITVEIL